MERPSDRHGGGTPRRAAAGRRDVIDVAMTRLRRRASERARDNVTARIESNRIARVVGSPVDRARRSPLSPATTDESAKIERRKPKTPRQD
eukprot:31282-Pelagococcus_subviridis.AAC.12